MVQSEISSIHRKYEEQLDKVKVNEQLMQNFKKQMELEKEKRILQLELTRCCHRLMASSSKGTDCWDQLINLLRRAIELKDDSIILVVLETIEKIKETNHITLKALMKLLIGIVANSRNTASDENVFVILKIINSFALNQEHKETLKNEIVDSRIIIDSNIYERYSLPLFLELYKTYVMFDFDDLLIELYRDLLVDWELWQKTLKKDHATKLLWYGFIVSMDRDLIVFSQDNEMFKDNSIHNDILIHHEVSNLHERWNGKSTKIFALISNLTSFNHIEKEKIRKVIHLKGIEIEQAALAKKQADEREKKVQQQKTINNEKDKSNKHSDGNLKKRIRKLGRITKLVPDNFNPTELTNLSEEIIDLALFNNQFEKNLTGYIRTTVLSNNGSGVAYVNEPLLKKVRNLSKNAFVDIINDTSLENSQNKNYPKEEKHKHKPNDLDYFKWPTTEIIGNFHGDEDQNQMKNESELKKMGYQITGVSTDKRWAILQRAVPIIGLKSIAYTIAHNVKLRKGQKDGLTKFKYAISQWEKDLARLKAKYYKHDFTWPKL